jgi:hypothetical protein
MLFHAEEQTDRHDRANSPFSKFCNKWIYETDSHQIIINRHSYTPSSITLNKPLSSSLLPRKQQNHDDSHHFTGTLQSKPYTKDSRSDNADTGIHDDSHHFTGTLQPTPYTKHRRSDNADT